MPIKKRTSGNPNLRGGGGSGGKISVSNTSGGEETLLGVGITELVWVTQDGLGFGATIDPENSNRVIIGDPPVFEPPISWSPIANTQVRVSESDTNEPDTFSDGGWANSVQKGTANGGPWWSSTLGRGLGPDAKLRVIIQHDNNVVEDLNFTAQANGLQSQNGVDVVVANYEEDGDGSAFQGRININISLMAYVPYPQSAKFTVAFQFTEHKWGDVINFSETFFYDKDGLTPVINGAPSVREHDDPAQRVIKYLSGIAWYDLNSQFTIEAPDIDQFNEDTSHPTAGLSVDASNFGIAPYTSSPWQDTTVWSNIGNLDTASDFAYAENRPVDVPNFRHVGNALVGNVVRDPWTDAPNKDSNTLKVCIDTFNNPSTPLVEYFDMENERLAHGDLTLPWNSKNYNQDGEAVFFGGSAYHGSDLTTINENVAGALGSSGSLSLHLPNEEGDGTPRQQPNYSGHSRELCSFIRKFTPADVVTTYSSFTMNILTNGDVGTLLRSGDLQVYIWKENSVNPASPNVGFPVSFNPTNPSASDTGSIWLHGSNDYNFGTFLDGANQDNSSATCRTKVTGTLVEGTFGGNDLIGSIMVRFSFKKGVRIDEIVTVFK